MKSLIIVLAALCLGFVAFFALNSTDAAASTASSVPIIAQAADSSGVGAGRIAYYTFDEVDGGVVNDHVVYNNGTVSGQYRRSTGVRNNALVFGHAQAEIPNQPHLNHDLNPFTISLWVQLRPDSSIWLDKRDFENRPKTIDGEHGGTFNHYVPLAGYSLWVSEHATDGTFINLYINQTSIEFNVNAHYPSGQSLGNGQWHHVAATVTPGQADGLVLYVNGAAVAWADATGLTQPYNSTTSMFVYGRGNAGVDEMSILNRALSAEEVATYAQIQP